MWGYEMPVRKVKGGYRWGSKGKVYKTKKEAEKQARAAYASGYKGKKKWVFIEISTRKENVSKSKKSREQRK